MTQEADTFITPAMRARIGVEQPPRTSPPVDRSLIRLWAISINWPEPPDRLFWDEEYAKKTRYGGIIAPPYFNPFAYAIDENRMSGTPRGGWGQGEAEEEARPARPFRTGGQNAGTDVEYFDVPIRPGDVITTRSKLVDLYERRSERTGLMLFTVTETTWTNQKGEVVKKVRSTGLRY